MFYGIPMAAKYFNSNEKEHFTPHGGLQMYCGKWVLTPRISGPDKY
jgi:hypothetical protein